MTTQDPSDRQLLDELACRRLMERYWYGEQSRNSAVVAEVFTADGRWGDVVGRDAIRTHAEKGFERMRPLEQHPITVGSVNLELDGDHCTGFIQAVAHTVHLNPDGTRRISVMDAIYHLTFTRDVNGWRIASMTGGKDKPLRPHGGSFQFNAAMVTNEYGGATDD